MPVAKKHFPKHTKQHTKTHRNDPCYNGYTSQRHHETTYLHCFSCTYVCQTRSKSGKRAYGFVLKCEREPNRPYPHSRVHTLHSTPVVVVCSDDGVNCNDKQNTHGLLSRYVPSKATPCQICMICTAGSDLNNGSMNQEFLVNVYNSLIMRIPSRSTVPDPDLQFLPHRENSVWIRDCLTLSAWQ